MGIQFSTRGTLFVFITDIARELILQSRPDILEAATLAGCPKPELTAFSYIFCEQEDLALQVMEDTARHLSIRIESLCFDGLILDYTGVADAEAADKEFHKEVESRLEEALGYKLFVVDKPWDTAEAFDEGEGL